MINKGNFSIPKGSCRVLPTRWEVINCSFSWGVQGGIFWEQLSSTDLDTRSHFSFPDGYDPIASNAETSLGNQGSYLSLSTGFRLRQRLQNGWEKFHLGLALRNANHLGKDGSLEDGTQIVLPYHINVSAAYRFLALEKISPTVYSRFIRRSGFNYVQSGIFMDFRPKSRFNLNNNIRTGIWYNSNRALGAQFQIHYPNYSLRFGYEFGIGKREQVWLGNGAFEFGMTIRFKSSRVKKPAEPILPPLPMYPKSYTNFNLIKPNEPLLSPGPIDLYVPRINYLGPTYTLEPEQMQVMFSPINIPFQFGEIELSEASLQILKPLIFQLKTYFGSKVLISGYTCNLGETKANKELSLKRALMVKEYLVRQGVNPKNIRVRGLGEANPLNQNASESERKINRRVIIEPDSY